MSTAINEVVAGQLVAMRGGETGRYEGRCKLTERHRVTTYKDVRGKPVHPKEAAGRNDVNFTVWLIADDGRCRGDKTDSPCDFVGQAPA